MRTRGKHDRLADPLRGPYPPLHLPAEDGTHEAAVSWITPDNAHSEHPPGLLSAGQSYVSSLVNAVMRGPDWKDTAAYLKFIEDDFLGSARLDPKTDGRPDPRPTVREKASRLGNLVSDFDFEQAPRRPALLTLESARAASK